MEPSLATVLGVLKKLSDEFLELREGVFKAVQIAEIDPEMALARCRKVLEFIVRDTFKRHYKEEPGTRPLENLIQKLVRDNHFPCRVEAYATLVRMLGNLGTHKFGERITATDVYMCLTQFMPILEWYFAVERQLPLDLRAHEPPAATSPATRDPDLILAQAHARMAEHNWPEAAELFQEYARHRPEDWEANYSRGVAYANTRGDARTNLQSLRAQNEAIAYAPADLEENTRARLFAYRGAILKRLGRLDEAESDLQLAEKYATNAYEVDDIHYNFASVFALRRDRERMMEMIRLLERNPRYLRHIAAHLHDYFAAFRNDPEFLRAIGA